MQTQTYWVPDICYRKFRDDRMHIINCFAGCAMRRYRCWSKQTFAKTGN